ncbi:hypothetical protein CRYUN_Cryun05aG0057500 [Craigia yunnanensis]
MGVFYIKCSGYMSPEYAMLGHFSEKSDVFSYGVLLLEIVSGRRNTSFYNNEHSLSLLRYVSSHDHGPCFNNKLTIDVAFKAWQLWNEDNILRLKVCWGRLWSR